MVQSNHTGELVRAAPKL